MRYPQDTKTAPVHVAKQNTEAADPAPSKKQDHEDSTAHSTATDTPVGNAMGHDLATTAEIIREAMGHRLRAEELLRSADPLAVELYQAGYRDGLVDGERRASERAAHEAARFINYLAEDPEATPGPIPPLENYRGAAA